MSLPGGGWEIEWRGGVRSFGADERNECALMMAALLEDGGAEPAVWINHHRLQRWLHRLPAAGKVAEAPLRLSRVLVVDEDPTVARRLRLQLQRLGYDASCACSAYHAARLGKAFDVIVSDVGLPGFRGNELLRQLHDDADGLVGITFSHRLVQDNRREYYTKPVTAAELHDAIQHAGRPLLGDGAVPA